MPRQQKALRVFYVSNFLMHFKIILLLFSIPEILTLIFLFTGIPDFFPFGQNIRQESVIAVPFQLFRHFK